MKKLALITALLLATSPVAAQSQQQALSGGGTTNSSQLPNTGIICQEIMTATFLQRTHQPEHQWLWIEPRYRIERRVRVERPAALAPARRPSIPARSFRRLTNCATESTPKLKRPISPLCCS